MPYPFQIVQSADNVLMTYEFASASRVVRMNSQEKSPAPAWMGWSIGRWDGESLVVDVTDHMDETWFDRAGNHHSDALKVTERYTALDANTLQYQATIEDPKVFSRPWTISMPLYRRREPNMQLMEYKCVRVRRGADVRPPAQGTAPPVAVDRRAARARGPRRHGH